MDNDRIKKNGTIDENETITVNIEGKDVKCDLLFSFEADINDNVYVGYTDNQLDENGKTRILVGRYKKKLGPGYLEPIETEEEYNMISDVLNKIQNEV
ncbi:MAG: DUF1292 domain-containing protein [Bacilli bacterium]|nr:DUF1292 domain-containing protein [Bacilli bacterium]